MKPDRTANVQADLNLPWAHTFEGTFSVIAAEIIVLSLMLYSLLTGGSVDDDKVRCLGAQQIGQDKE